MSDKKIKVLFLEPWGKAAMMHYVHSLSEELVDRGLDVSVLTSEQCDIKELPKKYHMHEYVKMWDFEEPPIWSWWRKQVRRSRRIGVYSGFWSAALEIIEKTKPDIVHFHDVVFEIDYAFIKKISRTGVVMGDTVHNVLPFGDGGKAPEQVLRKQPWVVWSRKRIYSIFDFLIFHTDGCLNEFADQFGRNISNLYVTAHGEFALYGESQVCREDARKELGLPPDAPVLLSFGIIRKYKGLDVAIRTIAEVCKKRPDAVLYVAGAVGSDVKMNEYQALARDLGVNDNIVWRLEYVPNSEVSKIYAAADIALLSHRMVYQSGPLLLAWRYRLPVAASMVGGLAELVRDGLDGFHFTDGDHVAAADRCLRIINDPELGRRMAAEGARMEKERHSWSASAKKLEVIYREAIDRKINSK